NEYVNNPANEMINYLILYNKQHSLNCKKSSLKKRADCSTKFYNLTKELLGDDFAALVKKLKKRKVRPFKNELIAPEIYLSEYRIKELFVVIKELYLYPQIKPALYVGESLGFKKGSIVRAGHHYYTWLK